MFSRKLFKGLYSFSQAKVATQDSLTLLSFPKPQIARITLNNPSKRNVLSNALLTELSARLSQLESEFKTTTAPSVIVLASTGTVFSSGHDLGELARMTNSERAQLFKKCSDLCVYLRELPQPVIAEVDGIVAAAGLQLVMSCDLVTSTTGSKYSCPGVKLGLFCSTPGVALSRASNSDKKTLEMLLTGDYISAEEAYQNGMINKLTDQKEGKEGLEKATIELADRILANKSRVFSFGKRKFYEQIKHTDVSEAFKFGTQAMVENLEFDECKAGLQSFLHKKHPK